MRRVIGWLMAAIIISLIFGSAYAALQQLGRRSAMRRLQRPQPQRFS